MGVDECYSLTMELEAFIATIIGSLHDHIQWKLPRYTPMYFHLLPRVSQTSSCFYRNPMRVHRLPFVILPWIFPPTSMEGSK